MAAASIAMTVFAVLFYMTVSTLMVIMNKSALGASLPVTLVWIQSLVTLACILVLSAVKAVTGQPAFWPGLECRMDRLRAVAPMTLVFAAMITLNTLCLRLVEASFYSPARSVHILFTLLLSYLVVGRAFNLRVLLACVAVTVGFLLASAGEINFSLLGTAFGVISCFFMALYSIMVKQRIGVLDGNHWVLMQYNTYLSIGLLFLVMMAIGETQHLSADVFLADGAGGPILLSGLCGFLINIASYLQIKVTSPLTHMVSGSVKGVIQSFLASVIFETPMTRLNVVGMLIVFGGSLFYTLEMRKLQRESEEKDGEAKKAQ